MNLDATISSPRPARLLVVDDEEIIVVSLLESLAREDYEVRATRHPLEALKFLESERFAAILTDQRMPEMTGLELLAHAKELQPTATRLLMTGVADLNLIIDAINEGEIYRFMVKPWLRQELLVTLKNAVQRYELVSQNAALQRTTAEMNSQLAALNRSLEAQVQRETAQNRKLSDLNNALEQNLRRSVELCLNTMQTFYPGLGVQARRVFEICHAMADGVGLPPEEKQLLEISAWLHDIGLVGVPRRLIRAWQNDPASLNPSEIAIIEQHPVIGQDLAGFVHHLSTVGEIIRAHHERFDGLGYPDRLSGRSIPWLGRLLAVAVAYAESDRDEWDSVEAIKRGSGTLFDPEAVRIFIQFRTRAAVSLKERQVAISDLKAGMILAQGIYTANGILLMPEGQTLNQAFIAKLQNHTAMSSARQSLLVYC